tara:strand:- start:1722 stop:1925 length:204 start_codon:yes stop_codon:yes gene_type:complete
VYGNQERFLEFCDREESPFGEGKIRLKNRKRSAYTLDCSEGKALLFFYKKGFGWNPKHLMLLKKGYR